MQASFAPLSERMRPTSLEDFFGQKHLVSPNGILYKMIHSGQIASMILWGPPGVGKTTLANIIAHQVKASFKSLSAISSGVKDVREVINSARGLNRVILFIDEIHRFNKSQQDALLGAVEKGLITLIGATTENPSFEVNAALLSRCRVYTLNSLKEDELIELLSIAMNKDSVLSKRNIELKETEALLKISSGDARSLLNLFEQVVLSLDENNAVVTDKAVFEVAQRIVPLYDKNGEQHYDLVSAFIKSIRGSDPNAAVYWLARMIEGGEDVKFIARRLLISAVEDIGMANPSALPLATSAFQAVQMIGYPEAELILSQITVYLANSPKSNSSYLAIKKAKKVARETSNLQVPLHLRNAPTKLMKNMDYGKGYKYPHDFEGGFAFQEYLPKELSNKTFYEPSSSNNREAKIREFLRSIWKGKYGY